MKTLHPHIELLETRIAPAALGTLDLSSLNGVNGFKIQGEAAKDLSGHSVSTAGDVNGDGFADLIIGAPYDSANGTNSGASYVVFGKAGGFTAPLNLSALDGTNGFKILGEMPNDQSGSSVSGAGDVNGDGFADLIIGAPTGSPSNGAFGAGASYVVFGKAGGFSPTLNLSTLNGTNGFKMQGGSDYTGYAVSGAGDVNGDGFADVVTGARAASPNGSGSGASYVVFGKASGFTATLDLSSLNGTNGFKIAGAAAGDSSGWSVSGAGDMNGDGFADLVIGAPFGSNGGGGASYVVFGKASGFTPTLNLSSLSGDNGFKIQAEAANPNLIGRSVSGAGDVNGDGITDLLIGASNFFDPNPGSGASYVIFGNTGGFTTPFDLSSLNGTNGFKIKSEGASDLFGFSVRGAGDVNGDGIADLIIGAPDAAPHGSKSGASYVVFGKASGFTTPLNVSALGASEGFKIQGVAANNYAGLSVSGVGDVNGDGFADLIVGAEYASPHGSKSGASYVIFGGKNTGLLNIAKGGKTAVFGDVDGDIVTVTTSKGDFTADDFTFVAKDSGVQLQLLDLHGQTGFDGANIAFTAKTPKGSAGDGLIDVDFINAQGVDLGTVSVSGRLEKIDAGDGALDSHSKAIEAIKSLTVGSLGEAPGIPGPGADYHSSILGPLGSLTVKYEAFDAFVDVTGATGTIGKITIDGNLDGSGGGTDAGLIEASVGIGAVTVKGSIIGGADHSGLISGGKLGKVAITDDLTSADPTKPVTISALGNLGATKAADAVAIAGVSVKTGVLNARILAGYDTTLAAMNPDAGIGAIRVIGNWSASSVAAGVQDTSVAGNLSSAPDGFGRNDTLISGDTTPTLLARIASITIKGAATGSASPTTDFFGITAQQIGALTIGTKKFTLTTGPDDLLLDTTNNDFRLVEI